MKKITKCINCGGGLVYNPTKNALICSHCDSIFALPVKKKEKLLRKYTIDFMPDSDDSLQNVYQCHTCGSTYVVSLDKVSTRCPSCGATTVSQATAKTTFPDGIVPFKLNKEEAINIFQKWIKKRKFAPNDLISMAKNGKMSKVYVPVFNINATSICAYSATVKKVHTDSDTGTIFSTVHTIQDALTGEIDNKPLCANSVVNSEFINKITNIKQEQIVPFSSEYLLGYYGTETNLDIHSLLENLKNDVKNKQEHEIRSKLNNKYDEIVHLSCNTQIRNITFNYTYVPVFMNHYTYDNKKYHCYISGVDGKCAGSAPKSFGKILALVCGVALGICAGIMAILKFIA